MPEKALRRLTVLQNEAAATPVPKRKYFHIGQAENIDDVGECVPMIAYKDDNLSRYVLSDVASDRWGRATDQLLLSLPNLAVRAGDGVFLISGPGDDHSEPHPQGKGSMHFVHLGQAVSLFGDKLGKLYVYRLEGVQVKGMMG